MRTRAGTLLQRLAAQAGTLLQRLAAVALALGLAGPATASPGGDAQDWVLDWEAPQGCPSQAQVQAEIEDLLRLPLSAWTPKDVTISVDVTEEAGGLFRAELAIETRDGRTTREIEHPSSCSALGRGVALVIALAIEQDPTLDVEGQRDEPDETEDEPPRPKPPRKRRPAGVDFGPLGAVSTGELPRSGFGTGGQVTVGIGRARLNANGLYWFPRSVTFTHDGSAQAAFWGWDAGLAAGYAVIAGGRVSLSIGVGLQGGQILTDVWGVSEPTQWRPWYLAAKAAGRLEVALGRSLLLTLGLEPLLSLTRPHFAVEPIGEIHRPATGEMRAFLGLSARFPAWIRPGSATK